MIVYTSVTVASRICARCDAWLGFAYWVGKDAWPAEPFVTTHTECDACLLEHFDSTDELQTYSGAFVDLTEMLCQ